MITIHQRHRQTDRQRDRRTDRQTDGQSDGRHAIPRPRICTKVHCAVKWMLDMWCVTMSALVIHITEWKGDMPKNVMVWWCNSLRYSCYWSTEFLCTYWQWYVKISVYIAELFWQWVESTLYLFCGNNVNCVLSNGVFRNVKVGMGRDRRSRARCEAPERRGAVHFRCSLYFRN